MSDEKKPVMVSLKSKSKKPKKESFEIERANALLTIKKSAWLLDDPKFVFNGTELAKK